MNKVDILGVHIDVVTGEQAVRWAMDRLDDQSGRSWHVVTVNPELVMLARREPEFAAAVEHADLVVADGIGVVWAAGKLGRPVPERVAGIDMTTQLLAKLAGTDRTVFFLGGAPGVAEEAATNVCRRFPGLGVAGTRDGYFTVAEEDTVLGQVVSSGADVVFVAMGAPRQELWISRYRHALPGRLLIGVGGAFDVWAGRSRRAPVWLQRIGLEWAYRVAVQPKRIGRLCRTLPAFIYFTIKEARALKG